MTALPFLLARFSLVQTCYQIGTVMMLSIGILAAIPFAPSPLWAALPLALSVVGTFVSLFPASALMKRWGRKRGLLLGIFLSTLRGRGDPGWTDHRQLLADLLGVPRLWTSPVTDAVFAFHGDGSRWS